MLFLNLLNRKRLLNDPKLLGRWGEKCASRFLKGKGFRVLAHNFRCAAGEIDIVCVSPCGCLCFVEVKTRQSEKFRSAKEAVNSKKQKNIIASSKFYLKERSIKDQPLRFDIVTVILGDDFKPVIKHYEKAFTSQV